MLKTGDNENNTAESRDPKVRGFRRGFEGGGC
jgi:hypothetical protein